MKVDVLLGLQWGDEGKGKVVDVLTPKYDVVARFQGGPNAGHTLEFKGEKYVLRSIPSGIFQGGKVNVIGNGVVLDPVLFKEEAEALAASGHDITKQLYISKKAHLILPTHRILDAAYEAAKGAGKIGTTGKGIGPTYTDKVSRNGVRVGDLLRDFDAIYGAAKARHEAILKSLNYSYDITELEAKWMDALNYLKQFKLIDSEHFINNLLKEDKNVLAEGAQGTMLDVDFGDVGVELIDGQYDTPYRNNEYVIGQYDFDADGADELIVGMRSRLADDMNGVSLNIWRIRDMKRWTFSTGMNILGDAICSFYMNKINIPRYHRGFYYEWTYQNGTFEFTGEI